MATADYQNLYEGLSTLEAPDGSVPETRMTDASQVRDMVTRAIYKDQLDRDWKRSRLKGLIDGNPPYSHKALVSAGRGDECNVNWRIAKYFFGLAKGMVYDVITEESSLATVKLDEYRVMEMVRKNSEFSGISPDQVTEWGATITEEFDLLQHTDLGLDATTQQSIGQMVLFGPGPQLLLDELDWRSESVEAKMLFVPELAKANTNKWEWSAVVMEYTPDSLYSRIKNAPVAQNAKWNVPYTRRCIMNAHPLTRTGVMYQNWSFHQDLLKNGTLYYSDQSKMIRVAHFLFREFPKDDQEEGRITHCMIDLDGSTSSSEGKIEFMYHAVGRYKNWNEVIHPMLWDDDPNGYFHSITGLGIEMYAALEYENRLLCRLADDAFAPKLFFKPTTASERERMSIAQVGRYAILPAALDMVQQHVQPFLQDGIAMSREVQQLVSSNLSQFRSNALTKQQGNPVTARQIDYEASEQAKMGKTQLSRIYEQYDWLYSEKYRRATNPNLTAAARGGKEAVEFQERCKKRGIPKEALRATRSVTATRVVGQGSSFMRQQALEFLLGLVSMLPETGRTNLVKQVIASRAGQSKVKEFYPDPTEDISLAQQTADATEQVGLMKLGIPPVPVPTQNPMVYASIFMQAAQAALQGTQQGGDPHEATAFLDLAIPAIEHHIQRMAGDKSRSEVVKRMETQLKQMAQQNDEIKSKLAEMAREQAAQQQQMQQLQSGMDSDTQIGLAKVQARHQVDMVKTQGTLGLKADKQNAELALKAHQQQADTALSAHELAVQNALADGETAASIKRKNAETAAKLAKPTNGKS